MTRWRKASPASSCRRRLQIISHLERARVIASSSLRDARRSVFALLPSVLHGRTLASALKQQLETVCVGVPIIARFKETGQQRAASNLIATEFIRIAQEATTNALRHAEANSINLVLDWDNDRVSITIADDGKGFDPSLNQPGFGLVSIRERASRMGAELTIDSQLKQGTRITVIASASRNLTVGKDQ
jgi:signal transduction histidine kinase